MPDAKPDDGQSPADAFQRLWEEGRGPTLADFLASAGDLPPNDLAEVVRVDQRQLWLTGKPVLAESYFEAFPVLLADPELAVDLIFHEYLLREQQGEAPEAEGFQHRFPKYAKTLGQQIALHQTLAPNGSTKSWAGSNDVAPNNDAGAPQLTGNFGRYRIERLLGQGGMGTVYLAYDTQLHRDVALKVPHFDDAGDDQRIERFYREARIAATFHHPNLCPVYDVGQIDGVHYLTMPYLQGEPLSELLRRNGRLPPAAAVRLAARIAQALDVAHLAGVLHRDLKPSNIMVQARQEPVVMDFGLARREQTTDPQLSVSGFIIGTAAYMPPEQIGGSGGKLGPASDVYSLGAVLYQMLTGRAPFTGTVKEILRQTQTASPSPPRHVVPGLDPQLERICLRALAKEPRQRYESAAAFAADLLEWLQANATRVGADTLEMPYTPTSRAATSRVWRRPWPWLAAFGAGIAIIAVVVAISWHGGRTPPPAPDPLPVNSHWQGTFRFRPPHGTERHDGTLDVTQRQDGSFMGVYATESDKWQWEITGTVHDGHIAWEFTRVIYEAEPRNLVGRAKVTGRLEGNRMELLYQDDDSIADMTLLRAK